MATGNTGTKNKVINLANVEFTENGLYVPNKGVTGFGKVKVAVPPDAMKKPLYVTPTSTDNNTTPLWDEYTGPYIDKYVKTIGYVLQNNTVRDFNGIHIGRKLPNGEIIDTSGNPLGKASNYRVAYANDDSFLGYVDEKNFAFDFDDNKIGKCRSDGNIIDNEDNIIGRVSQNEYVAYNYSEEEFVGVKNVEVRKVGAWIDSNISADNIRQGQTILGVAGEVVELHGEERTANSSTSTQIITPSNGKNAITKMTINPYVLQDRTVDPEFVSRTYTAQSGYNGLRRLTVNPINVDIIVDEEPNLKPANIKKNVSLFGGQIVGTYDNYVAPVVQGISISPSTENKNYTPPSGVDGFNNISVSAVTSSIDPNIQPENIRRGVTILGTPGTFVVDKLQDKTVDPQPYQQVVTFDSAEADGLRSVTVNGVTSSVDSNITSGNIKEGVTILGVTGDYDPQPIIQDPVTINPSTLQQSVTPDPGYDGLGRVNINAVTASIDPNILAENIKKNIDILGVTGSYDPQPNYQPSKTVQPVTSGDIEVTADPTYDALLKVIVKAVTASIDPNILPKNIRQNVSILGVLGTMEEGGGQKWFDFSGIQNFVELNQDAWSEGGNDSIQMISSRNDYELEKFINDTFPAISNINAIMFTQVYGYEDEEITDDVVEQCYINFIGGTLYQDYSRVTMIEDQKRFFYPLVNDYGVDGLTIGLANDDGLQRTMKLYVLTDSTQKYAPIPVLVNGDMTDGLLPEGYDGFRYVKEIIIPAHDVYIPKTEKLGTTHWVLRDEDSIRTRIINANNQPDIIEASAYDRNYGEQDNEIEIFGGYKLKNYSRLRFYSDTSLATQSISGETGYIKIPGSVQKQSGYYYYIKFDPNQMSGYNTYYTLFSCNAMFVVYLYRDYDYGYYRLGWRYSWSSSTAGSTNVYNYYMYPGTIYYIRVYVTGTTARLDFSSNGTSWTNNINTVSSSYINPTNTNDIYIYSSAGPNPKVYADGCYITDSNGRIVYSTTEEIKIKKTSHDVVPSIRDMLLVNRATDRGNLKGSANANLQFNSLNSSTKLVDFGTGGYLDILSGFNTSSASSWEIGAHIKLPSRVNNTDQVIARWWSNNNSSYWNGLFWNMSNGFIWRCYNANSYSSSILDTYIYTPNGNYWVPTVGTEYYIKFGWNGSTYYCYIATDKNFTNIMARYTTNSTTKTWGNGKITYGNEPNKGSSSSCRYIYMDDYSYIKINGEYLWKAVWGGPLRGNLVNYLDDGSATTLDAYLAGSNYHGKLNNGEVFGETNITSTGVVTNFDANNYIKLFDKFNPENNSWEIMFKCYCTTNSVNQYCIGSTNGDNGVLIDFTSSGVVNLWLSSNGSTWDIASNIHTNNVSYPLNSDFYVRLTFDGSQYVLEESLDKETWTTASLVTSSTPIHPCVFYIGAAWDKATAYLRGKIDLSESYIKINNTIWWQPEIIASYDYDWVFTLDPNWSYTGLINLGKKGTLVVPEHYIYEWDYDEMKWIGLKQLTFNVTNEDEFYTEIIEH